MTTIRRVVLRLPSCFRTGAAEAEHHRDRRGFRWIEDTRIDFKLGARMLVKYPGLSIIGGAGLISVVSGYFESSAELARAFAQA